MLRYSRSLVFLLAAATAFGCSGGGTGGTAGTGGHGGASGRGGNGGAGTTGSSGTTGTAGTTGLAGESGSGGTTGASGTGGAAGTSGSAGVSGASGSAGAAGTSGGAGAAGTTGTAGAGGAAGTTGSAGAGGAAGLTGSAGVGGAAGAAGRGGGSGGVTGTDGGTDSVCQPFPVSVAQEQVPTVYLLVDRSGSMFRCLTGSSTSALCADQTDTTWYKLKTAIEAVTSQFDAQVRFGFTTITGTNPAAGGSCPALQGTLTNNLPPAPNNAAAIAALYDSLTPPANSTQSGVKLEGPASESIANVAAALAADTTAGSKYIIFVTDGQPDYCDDGNTLCPPDSVIYQLQKAYSAGITTLVFGIQTALFDLPPATLQAFANAGAGEPTLAPLKAGGAITDFYDQCSGSAGWAADLTASGKPKVRGTTLGTYSTTMGPTMPYTPSASNQSQLVAQLSSAISGVKSCSFDLTSSGHPVTIDTSKLGSASVAIMGTTVPQDATNGWSVTSNGATIVLNGSACTTWRTPSSTDIAFNFPCDAIH